MASKKSPWLWTCGIGCGALVILVVAGVVFSGLFLRDTLSGFAEAVDIREQLEDRFGDEDDFIPPPGGLIPVDRVEAFVQVRLDSMEKRQAIADFFNMIPDPDEADELNDGSFWERLTFGLSMARGGIGLGADIGRFFEQRNQALLDNEMGLGEYIYIYCTAYYSFLRKPFEDGPGTDRDDVQIDTSDLNLGKIRRAWVGALEKAVEEAAEASEMQSLLVEELEKLKEDRNRLPWADGLPEAIAATLEPFRQDLENTYMAITNPFELAITEQDGNYSFTAK